MSKNTNNVITASELRTYLYSLEREKKSKITEEVQQYRIECSVNNTKPKKGIHNSFLFKNNMQKY